MQIPSSRQRSVQARPCCFRREKLQSTGTALPANLAIRANLRCDAEVRGVVDQRLSQVQLDVINGLGLSLSLNGSHFIRGDGQFVVSTGIELVELIDAIQHV